MRSWRNVAAVAALIVSLSSPSNAWFWDAEKGTVRSYEDCLTRNASRETPIGDIKIGCATKTAAPVPLDKVTVEYFVDKNKGLFYGHEQMSYPQWRRFALIDSSDYLLTDIVIQVEFPTEAAVQYWSKGVPEHRISLSVEGAKKSLERYEAKCTEKRSMPGVNTCGPDLFPEPDEPTIGCVLAASPSAECVKLDLISARGLKIVIE